MDSVVFDLDGTLWDTCETCALGWNRVLERHGICFRPVTAGDVRRVTGKPHEQCIREVFVGVPEAQILTLIEETRTEDNALVAELGGELYAGVADGLRALGARYPLFIVSNSQSGYIESFLAWSGFGNLFREFECWGNTRLPKGRNLGDQVAARECRVPFAHVEYGFGDCADADQRFASFGELTAWLLDSGQGT